MRFFLLVCCWCLPASLMAADIWVAVGYGGRRMVSTDGLHWTVIAEWAQPGGDDGNNLMSAVYAQGKCVVVGGGGGGNNGAGHILSSVDGQKWTEVYSAKNRINPIVYGGGRFVVGAPGRSLLWSSNGEKWTEGATLQSKEATHFRQGAYGNGRFVFVGNHGGGGGPHWSAVSKNGETIDGERMDLPGHGTLFFGAKQFLMLTSHNEAEVIASADGLIWNKINVIEGGTWQWLVWTGQVFMLGGKLGIFTSSDAKVWTKTPMTARSAVTWSDGLRSIATGWPGKMFYTANGLTWTDSPPLSANGINRVVINKE